ncbi:MAG: hypothetical protein QOF60_336, partial [Actinomycetota bacterium]|nr:hypothetical protein [Actinomycetota bacterium]
MVGIASLGADATLELLPAVTGIPEADIAVALPEVVGAGLVDSETGVLRLTADGDARLAATPKEWDRSRTRAAEALHRSGAPAAAVVDQLLQVPSVRAEWALLALRTAANEYRDAGDQRSAAKVLRRALEERPTAAIRRDVLLELALVEAHFDTEAAIATYRAVLPLVQRRARARP